MSDGTTSQEMSIEEWVGTLYDGHRAVCEYKELRARVEELERENKWMAAMIGDSECDAMREAMIWGSGG